MGAKLLHEIEKEGMLFMEPVLLIPKPNKYKEKDKIIKSIIPAEYRYKNFQ